MTQCTQLDLLLSIFTTSQQSQAASWTFCYLTGEILCHWDCKGSITLLTSSPEAGRRGSSTCSKYFSEVETLAQKVWIKVHCTPCACTQCLCFEVILEHFPWNIWWIKWLCSLIAYTTDSQKGPCCSFGLWSCVLISRCLRVCDTPIPKHLYN